MKKVLIATAYYHRLFGTRLQRHGEDFAWVDKEPVAGCYKGYYPYSMAIGCSFPVAMVRACTEEEKIELMADKRMGVKPEDFFTEEELMAKSAG